MRSTEQNQRAYDSSATEHGKLSIESTRYLAYRDIPSMLKKHLIKDSKKVYRVLDYGCGAGLSTKIITDILKSMGLSSQVYGTDINQKNLEIAAQKNPHAIFFHYKDSSCLKEIEPFDLVIANFVLCENEHSAIEEILENIRLILVKDGIALITNPSAQTYNRERRWCGFVTDYAENDPSGRDEETGEPALADGQIVKLTVCEPDTDARFTFTDRYHPQKCYRRLYEKSGFKRVETHEPLGKDSDGKTWKSEKEFSPYTIDILKPESS